MEVPDMQQFNALKAFVMEMKKVQDVLVSSSHNPEWLTVKQAAEKLNCHEDTVYKMARTPEEYGLVVKKGKKKVEISYQSILDYNLRHTIK